MKCCKTNDPSVEVEITDLTEANRLLNAYDKNTSNLISLLQDIQLAYGYLPELVLKRISEVTKIKEAKIFGVATFYSQFRMKAMGKNLIMLCQGTACHVNGSAKIEKAIKAELNVEEGEITEDGLFTYINVACLGCCSLAPVMMINDQTYAKLTSNKISEIINDIRNKEGE